MGQAHFGGGGRKREEGVEVEKAAIDYSHP